MFYSFNKKASRVHSDTLLSFFRSLNHDEDTLVLIKLKMPKKVANLSNRIQTI